MGHGGTPYGEASYGEGEPCTCCGTSTEIAIVPPTMKKSFEKFPKLGFLWHLAFNELKAAGRIIVIGVSFPDSDYYLKWLIRQAMIERKESNNMPELVIVNPNECDQEKNAEPTRNMAVLGEDVVDPIKQPGKKSKAGDEAQGSGLREGLSMYGPQPWDEGHPG